MKQFLLILTLLFATCVFQNTVSGQEYREAELSIFARKMDVNSDETLAIVCGPLKFKHEESDYLTADQKSGWRAEIIDLKTMEIVNRWDFERVYTEKIGGRWPDEIRSVLIERQKVALVNGRWDKKTDSLQLQVRDTMARVDDFISTNIKSSLGSKPRLTKVDAEKFVVACEGKTCFTWSELKILWDFDPRGSLGIRVFDPALFGNNYTMFDLYPSHTSRTEILSGQIGQFIWNPLNYVFNIRRIRERKSKLNPAPRDFNAQRNYTLNHLPVTVRTLRNTTSHTTEPKFMVQFFDQIDTKEIGRLTFDIPRASDDNDYKILLRKSNVYLSKHGRFFSSPYSAEVLAAKRPIEIVQPAIEEIDFQKTVRIPIRLTGTFESHELTAKSYQVRILESERDQPNYHFEHYPSKHVRVVNNSEIEIDGPGYLNDFLSLKPQLNKGMRKLYGDLFDVRWPWDKQELTRPEASVKVYGSDYKKITGRDLPADKTPMLFVAKLTVTDDEGRSDSKLLSLVALVPTETLRRAAQAKADAEFDKLRSRHKIERPSKISKFWSWVIFISVIAVVGLIGLIVGRRWLTNK